MVETENCDLPSLKELLSERTMIIMGAGSTFDYGFPLWADLKKTFLDYLTTGNFPDFSSHPGAQYWSGTLHSDTKKTVDRLAYDADDQAIELFMYMIYSRLVELEQKDASSGKTGWIEIFAKKYADLLKSTQEESNTAQAYLSNLTFCTLNYERCFAYRFGRTFFPLFEKLTPNTFRHRKLVGNTEIKSRLIYQPHGALGQFENKGKQRELIVFDRHHLIGRSQTALQYGAELNTLKGPEQNRIKTILPTPFIEFGKNDTYERVNRELESTKNIILIGLSKEGITQSALYLPANSKIYCTGSEQIVDGCNTLGVFAEDFAKNLNVK